MGTMRPPKPVKLFVGMLSSDAALFAECGSFLAEAYGPVDAASDVVPWEHTDYYAAEMGTELLRKFIFFERLVDPGELASVKQFTNRIEEAKATQAGSGLKRRINLDPGYITEAKVVLASTKDYAHRISIGGPIYAEVTLVYREKSRSFIPLEHTYPDFRTEETRGLFNRARQKLREQLRQGRSTS